MAKLTLNDVTSGYGTATRINANNTLIEAALENTLSRDGTSPNTMSVNLDMNSNRVINVADATGVQDAVTLSQVNTLISQSAGATTTEAIILTDGRTASYVTGVAGTDTITGGVTPTLTAYVTGQAFIFRPAATNTGAATININSVGAKSIVKGTGSVALAAGDMTTGVPATIIYNGTNFVLQNPITLSDSYTFSAAQTFSSQVTGTLAGGGTSTAFKASSATPAYAWNETDAAADNKLWDLVVAGEAMSLRVVNDASNSTSDIMKVDRTGTTVDSIVFPNGNVAVGTSSATIAKFITQSNTAIPSFYARKDHASQSLCYIVNAAASGKMFEFEGNGGVLGSITFAAGTTTYATTSDRRLKINIVDAPTASSLIDRLKVRSFEWERTGDKIEYGFIAQELYEVAPIAVRKGDDGVTVEDQWGVDPSKLVPLLVKELQDLRKRVAELEAKV